MTIFTCEHEWEAMLTTIYEAQSSGLGHKNIRLSTTEIDQPTFWDTYIHVTADPLKAQKVIDAVNHKLSPQFYHQISYASMAYEEDVLDVIYHVLILGFSYGPSVLEMIQYKDIFRFREISKRVGNEAHHFVEFLRFTEVPTPTHKVYVAHFEPKSRCLPALAHHFSDRMPSEHWVIVDDIHKEALVHPKDKSFYFQKLTDEEYQALHEMESLQDQYTDLWKTFFNAIAIEQRFNRECQRTLYPIWMRKHATEFM